MAFYRCGTSGSEFQEQTVTLTNTWSTQSIRTTTYTESDSHKKIVGIKSYVGGTNMGVTSISFTDNSVTVVAYVTDSGTYSVQVTFLYQQV